MTKIEINNVKNRFLPIPESVAQGLEPEPKITDFKIIRCRIFWSCLFSNS